MIDIEDHLDKIEKTAEQLRSQIDFLIDAVRGHDYINHELVEASIDELISSAGLDDMRNGQ